MVVVVYARKEVGGRRSVLLLTGSSKLCDRRLHLRSGQFERSGVF